MKTWINLHFTNSWFKFAPHLDGNLATVWCRPLVVIYGKLTTWSSESESGLLPSRLSHTRNLIWYIHSFIKNQNVLEDFCNFHFFMFLCSRRQELQIIFMVIYNICYIQQLMRSLVYHFPMHTSAAEPPDHNTFINIYKSSTNYICNFLFTRCFFSHQKTTDNTLLSDGLSLFSLCFHRYTM